MPHLGEPTGYAYDSIIRLFPELRHTQLDRRIPKRKEINEEGRTGMIEREIERASEWAIERQTLTERERKEENAVDKRKKPREATYTNTRKLSAG